MTTARSSPGNPGPARGRGLDALFEGTTFQPAAAARNVDADLAALLDNEVSAAETGALPGAAPAPATRSVSRRRPRGVIEPPLAGVDVPPSATEAQPVEPPQPAPPQPAPPPPAPAPAPASSASEADRRPPTTKRFGAIIMDTPAEAPPVGATPAESATSADALVPTIPGVRSVMPPASGQEPETPAPLPAAIERTDDQKAIVISRLAKLVDTKKINLEIDDLYKQVATEFSSPPAKAELALGMLREARQILLDTPEETVSAEYRTMQVQAMLQRVQTSRKQAAVYASRIFIYQAAWLAVLLAGMIFAGPLASWIAKVGTVSGPSLMNIYPIFNTMIWGGIGGIVGALYSLWWHISEQQDFDRNYLTWYLVQPLLGLVLGGIVFLLLAGGFLILQVNLTDDKAVTGARLLPYLTAVLAGFRQNFIYEQFNRLISMFAPPPSSNNGGGGGSSA